MQKLPEICADFLDFLRLLTAHEVRFVVVGGYAVAAHGYLRYTVDFDVFVEVSKPNAMKLVTVFRQFGLDLPALSADLFLTEGKMIRTGYPPYRLEILTRIDGVSFAECYRDRVLCRVEELDAQVTSFDLLLRNKVASGRSKDLVDVEHLTRGASDEPFRAKEES